MPDQASLRRVRSNAANPCANVRPSMPARHRLPGRQSVRSGSCEHRDEYDNDRTGGDAGGVTAHLSGLSGGEAAIRKPAELCQAIEDRIDEVLPVYPCQPQIGPYK